MQYDPPRNAGSYLTTLLPLAPFFGSGAARATKPNPKTRRQLREGALQNMDTNSKKSESTISQRIPEPLPDPVEANLDPQVKAALSQMADKVRERARERAEVLEKDLSVLIRDFVRDYGPIDHRYAVLKGIRVNPGGDSWESVIEKLCEALGNYVGEIEVERYVQNLSAKILEIDPTH